jgi:N-acetylneuraminic acid mutarotase
MQQQMYLFGGSDNSKYFNELYSFNTFTNQWKLIDTKGQTPSPRDPMAFLSIKN